ncbi:TetR/AcrR family transcriptional regulator C-terminal domain-containing protein [Paenibacillus monticola]|uniref:Transcriptional regulator TetR C-terminal Proteobacteria type domain-containing protein n=1 Tax=Paenibacillus monticola TaxID=2666075 RepID=A0A7X2H770_9BACL|nr:TetR/AcrR family transcriptional regulator C-terminal domain-containing protein [Paenibacillus monticola]MRN54703.1 hypothetical protein [Paenibacillus monticola]
MAGIDYLQHALMKEQLALYRVVTQDAHRFPGLGSIYREEVLQRRNDIFTCYLIRWAEVEHWEIKDTRRAAVTFAALQLADIFEDALHGLHTPDSSEISARATFAADNMLILLKAGVL